MSYCVVARALIPAEQLSSIGQPRGSSREGLASALLLYRSVPMANKPPRSSVPQFAHLCYVTGSNTLTFCQLEFNSVQVPGTVK